MRAIILFLLLVCMTSLSYSQNTSDLLRTPAISPQGDVVAFSFQGDIWRMNIDGGELRRLTIHEAYESNPVWSPKGDQIAFTGARYGNNDVFTVIANGGVPKRLTHHSSGDMAYGWSNDEILFTTRRAFRQVEWDAEIYAASPAGGTPERILNAVGDMPVASPNGRFIAIVRGACRVAREQYKGPADNEIWIYDTKNNQYHQLTDNEMNDYLPRWSDDNTLYYISATSGRYNIVKQAIDAQGKASGGIEAITNFKDDGVRHFDIAANTIVFERKTSLYKMKEGGSAEEIKVNIQADYRFDPEERKTFTNGISNYVVSPNGKYIAMEIRGEIFVKENDKEKKRSVNISNHPYRDQQPAWLNDSTLLFISDRDGQKDIYLAKSADDSKPELFKTLKLDIEKITKTGEHEMFVAVSPDGKKVAHGVGRGILKVSEIDEKGKLSNTKTLLDGWSNPRGVAWSPDSRWLAYSLSDLNFNSEIYIHAADNSKEPVNVSMHPRGDYGPFWSADGNKLGFVSNRNSGDNDVWFVWLNREEYEKTERDREEGYYFEDEEEDANEEDAKKEGKKDEKEVKPIVIDFERIHDRLAQVTSMPGNEGSVVISKDGEKFYFVTSTGLDEGSDLYEVKWDGKEIKQLTKGGARPGNLRYYTDEDEIYYTSRGSLAKIKKEKTTRLPHRASMVINYAEEREQIFEEAWSALNEGFYDPKFHGNDWDALKKKYKPWALTASTTQDFRYMYNIMLGQLNASHMGLYGSDPEKTQRESTGRLGIEIKPVKNGVEITHVVPNTPADKIKSQLREGEVITAVNGQDIDGNTNFYSLFAEETDNQVLLKVENAQGTSREVVIRPSRSISTDLYEEWVRERSELTNKYSNGRLGYIHIRGMNMTSFERFERELMASGLGKDGIVIDVRYNGGGWTTDYLMTVLNVKQHAYTIPRGAVDDLQKENKKYRDYYPYSERLPLSSWTKPSVAMCNESSYSNAEIFSHAYKTLDIGTLVGKPTFGAVISTGGQGLIDGSYVRMPFRAWYVKATGENMENGPAVPDVLVDNAPDSKANGEDPQLKKAVEVLLGEMGE
ncbi:PDZ domain-containing protein [Fulvivirga sp. RKSG066]|uniref:S41 family peptidase n=1 Tax=Fulvivirga aurantia TaxID=2529383 RepID=UPI0012BC46C0|nr:S41 family peptidase [Fulvivirga aurantia]MTI21518.1 PDZ domain-containing protein [Fulvivirga aurantia]